MSGHEMEFDGTRRHEPVGSSGSMAGDAGGAPERLLLLASLATVGVALWLLVVSVRILPARDPAHVTMWRWIAVALLGYAGVSLGYLRSRRRSGLFKGCLILVSGVAVGAGVIGIVAPAHAASHGRHFEGYLVLMGWILCCHGVTAVAAVLAREKKA